MILLDANALIALLVGEPAEEEVAELLRRGCAIPAVCLSEVANHLIRDRRVPAQVLPERLGPLLDELVPVVGVDSGVALRAGEIRGDHYSRRNCALSLADCLLLASAGDGDEIATCDGAVAATAHKLGIEVIPLPDSSGRRPTLG